MDLNHKRKVFSAEEQKEQCDSMKGINEVFENEVMAGVISG